jgi:hypothetical protein
MSKPRKRAADIRRLSRLRLTSTWVTGLVTVATGLTLPRFTPVQIIQLVVLLLLSGIIGRRLARTIRSPRAAIVLGMSLEAVSVIGTGVAFLLLPIGEVFDVVRLLWPLAACGALITARRSV